MGIFSGMGGMSSMVFGWFTSIAFWVVVAVILFAVLFLTLKVKQNMKFQYPCLEITSLGKGKVSMVKTKAGWFKKHKIFFGLIDGHGEFELICKADKRKIFNASSEDYHEIDGKRGLIVKRKDDDPEILVPINDVEIKGLKMINEIAPADYRDAAVDILERKQREITTWWDKNQQMVISTIVYIFGIIALVLIFNFAKGESTAWREFAQQRTAAQVVSSTVAP
jgi:hypothetical protein